MRRFQLITLLAFLILALSATAVSAQIGQLRGHVLIKQADGTTVPAAGAQIDVYRTDSPGKYPSKADKKGQFVYAGLPYVGTYVIAASAPNAAPTAKAGVKVGRDIDYEIVLLPGDGRRFTEEEAKSALKANPTETRSGNTNTGGSAADKAKAEEIAKKNAEVARQNEKIGNANKIIDDAFKNGNATLMAGNEADKANNREQAIKLYGDAVQQYDSGLNADPEHPGIPSLLTNKSVALRSRGVDRFNLAVQSKDDAAKTSGTEVAKSDFTAAAEAANRAVDLVSKQTPPTDPEGLKQFNVNKYFALSARAEAMRLFVTKVDSTKADAATTAFQEYIAIETDPAKKTKAQKDLAQMMFETATDAAGYERAMAEYQKILAATPDDPDALLRIGQILFNIGALNNNDKAKYQEAANYLQRYVEKAPDGQLKSEAKELIDTLKAQANVTPEKINTPPRRRRP